MVETNSVPLLEGYRVLDLTDEKGLLCGKVLGDLGADVVKVEKPRGDRARDMGPFVDDIPDPEKSFFWFFTNLNKRGITLNLESHEGKEIFRKLAARAHVVLESFEPGYLEGIGLGYAELERINPAIILTSITPFGQKGPYAHFKAMDLVGSSLGGMVRIYGDLNEAPCRIGLPQFFFLGSLHGAAGSILALYQSQMTGEGQWVDVSCQEAMAKSLMDVPQWWDLNRVNIKGTGSHIISTRREPLGELRVPRIWACKDGHVIFMFAGGAAPGMVASSKALVELANENGMALEIKDYDWAKWDASSVSQEEADRLVEPIAQFLMTKTKAELLEEALKRSILMAPIQHIGDLVQSEQLKAREFWVEVDHPELGKTITYPGFPVKMTGLTYSPKRRAPRIGEHNGEIYGGELGLSGAELVLLKTQGII